MRHEPVLDDSEILRESFEENMNVKGGSGFASAIVVGLIVGAGSNVVSHWLDGSKDRELLLSNTATAVATLKTSVDDLSDRVKLLTEQPYVRRDEFADRISGLEQRVSIVERNQQSNRGR